MFNHIKIRINNLNHNAVKKTVFQLFLKLTSCYSLSNFVTSYLQCSSRGTELIIHNTASSHQKLF